MQTTTTLPQPQGEVLPLTRFDGATSYPLSARFHSSGNQPRSVLVWLKNERSTSGFQIFGQGTFSPNQMWTVTPRTDAEGLAVWALANDINSQVTVAFEPGVWHHLGATWDGTRWAFYYDGNLAANGTHHQPFNTQGGYAFYGSSPSPPTGGVSDDNCATHSCWFKGEACDLRYFNHALTDEQVASYVSIPRCQEF